jgi:hypothetical protein
MNDPGMPYAAVSGQREQAGQRQVRGCRTDRVDAPTLAATSEQLAHLGLVPFISLSGTKIKKTDG